MEFNPARDGDGIGTTVPLTEEERSWVGGNARVLCGMPTLSLARGTDEEIFRIAGKWELVGRVVLAELP